MFLLLNVYSWSFVYLHKFYSKFMSGYLFLHYLDILLICEEISSILCLKFIILLENIKFRTLQLFNVVLYLCLY